jgi:nitroreductase
MKDPVETVLGYHQRTKHHLHRYARSLGFLDWATKPAPFRTYAEAPRIALPLTARGLPAAYQDLYRPGAISPHEPDLKAVGALFELSLGLSAWKEHGGNRWALRANPSSGNLHPTEGYLVTGGLPGILSGVYHYQSHDHVLEHRSPAVLPLPEGTFLVALSSIHWREVWKYGERGYRYSQHDAGHALAAVRYAAAALGWPALLLSAPGDEDLGRLLGIEPPPAGAESEDPDLAILVAPHVSGRKELEALGALCEERFPSLAAAVAGTFEGIPNRLSRQHHPWPIVEEVARAARKPRTPPPEGPAPEPGELAATPSGEARPVDSSPGEAPGGPSAAEVILKRRSALDFDGETPLSRADFYGSLRRVLPSPLPPWDAWPWPPRIHLVLFVHRVIGLPCGIYLLARSPAGEEGLRGLLRREFVWRRPTGCPVDLPLHLLLETDARESARIIACHQEIASDGAFSLAMLAEFEGTIGKGGPFQYPRLFWEAGVLGQVLYLEAEARGARATGIGCYFDDACHTLLGLEGSVFQDLYHFTVGTPVEDPRLQTHPPYQHLKR